ncbi:MAG: glycosyltransferase [Lachnospiraceae bacterium]|nr:glycosyltransferase [Lachnospiraceae bacterium]
MGAIKDALQDALHKSALRQYEKELARQKDPYAKKRDDGPSARPGRIGSESYLIPYSEASASFPETGVSVLIYAMDDGWLTTDAADLIERFFRDNPQVNWLYPDEDVCDDDGICCFPYYKPAFSPDTLLSYFYVGGIFAVQRKAAEQAAEKLWDGARSLSGLPFLYALCLQLGSSGDVAHMQKVLYHGIEAEPESRDHMLLGGALCAGKEFDDLREAYFRAQGIKGHFERDEDGFAYPLYDTPEGRVSILILSKDHPELLKACVSSIRGRSSHKDYEILVTDNGSSPEARAEYEALAEEYSFRYIYEPMEFNFSALCNLSAEKAEGSWLLFLNDDTEVLTPDWLERMLGQAAQSGVGAVGAKLYYPGKEKRIQHCGVANLETGPLHRLNGWEDDEVYDRGRNRGARNVLAVTGACLLVSRKLFVQEEGFFEELPVAYNDVDLCLRLLFAGYGNVIRNDVRLIHHESASRGDDLQDAEKKERLMRECCALYKHLPGSYGLDPYEGAGLSRDSERYEAAHPCEIARIPVTDLADPVREKADKGEENEALIVNRDRLGPSPAGDCFLLDIYAHVRGQDNADYDFSVYFEQEGYVFRVPVTRRYRADVEQVHHDQLHVGLSGLSARLAVSSLPPGELTLRVEAKSRISRQRLRRSAGTVRFDAFWEIC